MYAMFAVVYKCCRGRAVTNVVRTCSPTPLLKRQLNMFKLCIPDICSRGSGVFSESTRHARRFRQGLSKG